MNSCALRLAILCLVAMPKLSALDVIGEPPAYVAKMMMPQWRLVPLVTVLDELEKHAAIEIKRSSQIQADDKTVVFMPSPKEIVIKDLLALVERSAPVRFTLFHNYLSVETKVEYDQRRREVRWYEWLDYSLVTSIDNAEFKSLGFKGPPDNSPVTTSAPHAWDPDYYMNIFNPTLPKTVGKYGCQN